MKDVLMSSFKQKSLVSRISHSLAHPASVPRLQRQPPLSDVHPSLAASNASSTACKLARAEREEWCKGAVEMEGEGGGSETKPE
jgi:hypothetical protein